MFLHRLQLLVLTFAICNAAVRSASAAAPLRDSIPFSHFITVRHDNDCLNLIGGLTDRAYTAGLLLDYSFVVAKKNFLQRILWAPRKKIYSIQHIGINTWLFTPNDLKKTVAIQGDYPYAGLLFLNFSRRTVVSPKTYFQSDIWLGILGPTADGRAIQTFIHRNLDFELPLGWNTQLPDYPILNYNVRYETALTGVGRFLHLSGFLDARVGSLLDEATAGFAITLVNVANSFYPAQPGETPAAGSRKRYYFIWQPAIRYVGYNAILQGGIGTSDKYYSVPASAIDRMLFESKATAGVQVNHFLFQYDEVYTSREFATARSHTYGSIGITYCF